MKNAAAAVRKNIKFNDWRIRKVFLGLKSLWERFRVLYNG
jgi:hypothetical protein